MKLLQHARPDERQPGAPFAAQRSQSARQIGILMPTMASASEGDNVVLHFGSQDTVMLWIAFAVGAISLLYSLFMRGKILKELPGSERMQEVGKAIHDGALAYLKQQVMTMSIFVLLLAAGLTALF